MMLLFIVYGLGFAITFKWMAEGLLRTEDFWPVITVSLFFAILWPALWLGLLITMTFVLVVTKGRP